MPLYDAYGRPVDTQALRGEQAAPTVAGIRNIYSVVHPSQNLSPERLVAVLRTAEMGDPWLYLELAEDMEEKDLHYLSVLSTRKHAVAQLELSVQAASEDPADVADADFVREVLLDGPLDLRTALFDILDAIGKGFSVTEITWDTGGREWIPAALTWRDPRWFMFDWVSGEQLLVRTLSSDGTPLPAATANSASSGGSHMASIAPNLAMTRTGAEIGIQPATAPLRPFKFITHLGRAKSGLPIRGGIARLAAWAYLFKTYVLKDWVAFGETYGQPLRVGKYGPGASEQDKQALLQAVASIGADATAIIPQSMLIEFIEAKITGSIDLYEKLCDWLDRQTSKGVLGQTLTTELPKGGGSRAAAEVHDAVRRDIAADDAQRLCGSLNRDLVKPLIDLNRGPRARYPRITLGFPSDEDLETLSAAITPFIDRGLPVEQREVLKKFGLSLPAAGAPILHPAEKIQGQDAGSAPAPQSTAELGDIGAAPFTEVTAARKGDTPALDAIDLFCARLRDESDTAMAPIVKPLLAEMRQARSYEDLKRRMVRAVRAMDPSEFEALMARAGFAVDVAGNLGLQVTAAPRRRKRPSGVIRE